MIGLLHQWNDGWAEEQKTAHEKSTKWLFNDSGQWALVYLCGSVNMDNKNIYIYMRNSLIT